MIDKDWVKDLYNLEKFSKYSQNGEESYLEYMMSKFPREGVVVEFGAGDGLHLSNTKYFLEKGYNAIMIDRDNRGNDEVKQHNIIRENIVPILKTYNCPKVFDFLSVDIDGNDFWIMDELLTHFSPNIVIAEFNAFLPVGTSVSIKYDSNYSWDGTTYFGFSMEAGKKLAEKHGYKVIFQNNDMNIYMVKNEYLDGVEVPEVTYTQQYYFEETKRTDWEVI